MGSRLSHVENEPCRHALVFSPRCENAKGVVVVFVRCKRCGFTSVFRPWSYSKAQGGDR